MSNELYKKIILQRSKSKKHRAKPINFLASATKKNPLCGDEITIYLTENPNSPEKYDLYFEGYGCAICLCSADFLAETCSCQKKSEMLQRFQQFLDAIQSDGKTPPDFQTQNLDFEAIAKVRNFPSRIKCAILAWQAAQDLFPESSV